MSFFNELKRRNVFRVGIAYTVAAWLLIQVTDIVFPRIGLPDSAVTLVIALLAIGFIPALIFAWAPISPIKYPAKDWLVMILKQKRLVGGFTVGATGKAGRDQRSCASYGEIATGFAGCSYNQISRWCNK